MIPRQKLIVQSTFERAQPNLARVGKQLYRKLFAKYPEMRQLFAANMSEQHVCFAAALAEVIKNLDYPEESERYLRDLGARHARYGIEPTQFTLLEPLLIVTMRLTTGEPFNRETYRAWRAFCRYIATAMTTGYREEMAAWKVQEPSAGLNAGALKARVS